VRNTSRRDEVLLNFMILTPGRGRVSFRGGY
jgi:hypothetical protein